jgi:hypothetical protein
LKLKKTNGVKMSIPPFQRIIQRWFLKDSQWMNKLLDKPSKGLDIKKGFGRTHNG